MDTLTIAILLILLGLAFLVAEVFIPSGGILFGLAVVAILVGITLSFSYDPNTGLLTVLAVFLFLPVLAFLWFYIFPKTPIGKRFFLAPPSDETLAQSPTNVELEQLRGRVGKTVSPLRPAGTTDFNGKRVDTISEGALIGPDEWVQCIDVKAGTVIVRQVDGPPDLENMDTSLL